MIGKDLGCKPGVVEKARFEYSSFSEVFDKGLIKEKDKKQELLKKLKNIEDKIEEQLKAIKDQEEKQLKIYSQNKIKKPLLQSI